MLTQVTSIFRRIFMLGMMRLALAGRIILFIKTLRKAYISIIHFPGPAGSCKHRSNPFIIPPFMCCQAKVLFDHSIGPRQLSGAWRGHRV